MEKQPDTYNVINWIDCSQTMEFAWSKNDDQLRHTGVVIKFNNMPVFTLDFGADDVEGRVGFTKIKLASLKAAARVSATFSYSGGIQKAGRRVANAEMPGEVKISIFDSKTSEIMGNLARFSIQSREEKDNCKNLIKAIQRIDMGSYKLMENNCRNYVIVVATLLREFPELEPSNWNKFELEMQKLLSEDHKKFTDVLSSAERFLALLRNGEL